MTTHKYGPNGEAVEKIIERVKRLTEDEVQRLAAAWDARDTRAAWAAQDVRDVAWAAARDVWDARAAAWEAWDARAAWAMWAAAWDAWAARDAMLDAILAELTRDLITPEQYDLLIGPWRSVIGEHK